MGTSHSGNAPFMMSDALSCPISEKLIAYLAPVELARFALDLALGGE